jgi:hypothetical protein
VSDRELDRILHEHGRRLAEGPWDQFPDAVGVPTAGRMNAHALDDVRLRRKGKVWEMVRREGTKPENDTKF